MAPPSDTPPDPSATPTPPTSAASPATPGAPLARRSATRPRRPRRVDARLADRPAPVPAWAIDATAELPPLLADHELAAFLRLDVRTLRKWRGKGKLTSLRTSPTGSGRVLTPRAEVARLLVALSGADVA